MQRNPREAHRFGPGRGPAVDLVPFGGTVTTVPAPPGIPTLTVPFDVRVEDATAVTVAGPRR